MGLRMKIKPKVLPVPIMSCGLSLDHIMKGSVLEPTAIRKPFQLGAIAMQNHFKRVSEVRSRVFPVYPLYAIFSVEHKDPERLLAMAALGA